jgi:PAS domain S-box-containing protein
VLDDDGYFQRWNERVPEVTGYTDSELVDMHATDIISEDDRDKVIKSMSEVLQGQQPAIEAHLQTVDGQQIPFEFTGNRLSGKDKDKNTTKVIGIGRNVSGRNERQRQLNVLDRVLRHNLRNEINVIRGHAEVIDENVANGVEQSVRKIVRKSNDIIETANKSRKITKIAQQRPESEIKCIRSLLNRIIQNISQNHPEAVVEFECPSEVEVDVSIHFEKALSELITNAIVHNDSSSPSVVVTVSLSNDMAQIKIADDGPRIPEVERQVLLQEDEQTPLYHGSGLGLSLARLVISRSGGTIFYADSSSGGNSIVIEVPKC